MMHLLFADQTGTTVGDGVQVIGDATLIATGGFGGGTLQLQVQNTDGNWAPVDGGDITAEIAKNISVGPVTLRAVLIGASTAPSLTVNLASLS